MQTHIAHKNTEETIQNTWVQLVRTTLQQNLTRVQEPLRLLVEVSGKGPVKSRLTSLHLAVTNYIHLWWLSFWIQKSRNGIQEWLYIELNKRLSNYIKILFNMLLSDAISIKLRLYLINFGALFYYSKPWMLTSCLIGIHYMGSCCCTVAERRTQGINQTFPCLLQQRTQMGVCQWMSML